MNTIIPSSSKSSINNFSVKRKQINFNKLENSISRNSSSLSIQNSDSFIQSNRQAYQANQIKEKDDKINELRAEIKKLNEQLQTTRHQNRLMENERQQFETNMKEKYSKEKENVELELKLLKETHVEKVQHLANSIDQLYKRVDILKTKLKQHNIEYSEEENAESIDFFKQDQVYQKDAQFIEDAYKAVNQLSLDQPLWSNVQHTTSSIKQEINQFNAWKSIPIMDLVKVLREDQKHHTTVKSLLFGRRSSK